MQHYFQVAQEMTTKSNKLKLDKEWMCQWAFEAPTSKLSSPIYAIFLKE
jgi:hypothetical protein